MAAWSSLSLSINLLFLPVLASEIDFRAKHWAYIPPTRTLPPKVKNDGWPKNAVDRFILARLEKENLRPSPQADRSRLLRRVYLDLIGLPPSPREVEAF